MFWNLSCRPSCQLSTWMLLSSTISPNTIAPLLSACIAGKQSSPGLSGSRRIESLHSMISSGAHLIQASSAISANGRSSMPRTTSHSTTTNISPTHSWPTTDRNLYSTSQPHQPTSPSQNNPQSTKTDSKSPTNIPKPNKSLSPPWKNKSCPWSKAQ